MKYVYQGPDSGITLQDKATQTDVLLRNGKTVTLPAENAAVKTLVARGFLVEVTSEPAPAPAASSSSKSSKSAKE